MEFVIQGQAQLNVFPLIFGRFYPMNFSFGIVTDGNSEENLNKIITSIRQLQIPNYEIIIIGGSIIVGPDISHHKFNESEKPGWITRKKNLITEFAKYENIVFLHDYLIFDSNWYSGYLRYGNDFNICMNRIENTDHSRFGDWLIWHKNNNFMDEIIRANNGNGVCLIPYELTHLTPFMYISGTYWVAKKYFMKNFPLDETRVWGEGEDLEWSARVRQVTPFKINQFSTVRSIKQKAIWPIENYANDRTVELLKLLR
jgi:hypothetical protein